VNIELERHRVQSRSARDDRGRQKGAGELGGNMTNASVSYASLGAASASAAAAAGSVRHWRDALDSDGCRPPGVASAPLPLNYIDVVGPGATDDDRSERRPKRTTTED